MALSEQKARMLDFYNFFVEDRSIKLPYTLELVDGAHLYLETTNVSSIFSSISCSVATSCTDGKLYIAILPVMKISDKTGNKLGHIEGSTNNRDIVIILAKLAGITTEKDYSLFLDPLLPYRISQVD